MVINLDSYVAKQRQKAEISGVSLVAQKERAAAIMAGGRRTMTGGTVFKRELKTSHSLLGTKIKDVAISETYSDVYDGQGQFFPILERNSAGTNLTEGEVAIGDTAASCNYLIETPVHRKPLFGSGELIGLDLNLFHDKN